MALNDRINSWLDDIFSPRPDRTSPDTDKVRYSEIRQAAERQFKSRYLEGARVFRGKCLYVYGASQDRLEIAHASLATCGEVAIGLDAVAAAQASNYVRMRVRVEELHAHIPEPCKIGFDDPNNRSRIEMHPLFVSAEKITNDRAPNPGDVVVVSFGRGPDFGLQQEGQFHGIYRRGVGGDEPSAPEDCGTSTEIVENRRSVQTLGDQRDEDLPSDSVDSPFASDFIASHPNNYATGGNRRNYIVIHTVQGQLSRDGSSNWAKNPSAQVSAHYWVRSVDGNIVQMVKEADRAYHVGNANNQSIGIEHEGRVQEPDFWYTEEMYRSSAALTADIAKRNNIPINRSHIIGHNEADRIGYTGDHYDPGDGWDWDRYMRYVQEAAQSN